MGEKLMDALRRALFWVTRHDETAAEKRITKQSRDVDSLLVDLEYDLMLDTLRDDRRRR